jgi:multidrug efflux pump subunit AcrB
MLQTIRQRVVKIRPLVMIGLVCAAVSAAGCAQGQYIARATLQWPGASPRQLDDAVAAPVGRALFGGTNGIVAVTSISSPGKVEVYATSDGLTRKAVFEQAVSESLADAAAMLPRGVVAGPIEVLPNGQPVPRPTVHNVNQLRIDIDRAKLVDAEVTEKDADEAAARTHAGDAFRVPDDGTLTPLMARQMIKAMSATTVPSREKPVTLGDVANVHFVAEPDLLVRHWP